jgi:hypothetical protein
MLAVPLLLILLAGGCSMVDPIDFRGSQPELVLEDYFQGPLRAWGIVQDRSGKIIKQFTVDLHGEWKGEEFVLTEHFVYRDGHTDSRIWRIRKIDAHHYEGRAGDVIGVAKGETWGQALHWRYTLRQPVGDTTYDLAFDDWMFLHQDGVMINRSTFSKFGFRLGEVTLVFRKGDQQPRASARSSSEATL